MSYNPRLKILMTQQQIADATGYSQPAIHYVLKGDRTPSIEMAVRLEPVTGTCREAWLWPERHYNPYIPFDNIKGCMTCTNRKIRTKKAIEIMIDHFATVDDKQQGFKNLLEIFNVYTGLSGVIFFWREFRLDGMHLLAHTSESPTHPEILRLEEFSRLTQLIKENEALVIEHFPYDIEKSWEQLFPVWEEAQVRSALAIGRDPLLFVVHSVKNAMVWTEESVKATEDFVETIRDLYIESGQYAGGRTKDEG